MVNATVSVAEAEKLARRNAPAWLSKAEAVASFEDDQTVVVKHRPASGDDDLFVSLVDRATGAVTLHPFVAVIDKLNAMRELPGWAA